MTVTLADLPPEFAAVDEATANFWIGAASAAVDSKRWICAGVDPDEGIKLLASHMLKLAGLGSGGVVIGTIASKSIGGVSVSLTQGASASGPNGSTVYGQAFDAMQARVDKSRRRHLPPGPQPSA
jgi:hypothetical protein